MQREQEIGKDLTEGLIKRYKAGFIDAVEDIYSEIGGAITEPSNWRGFDLSKTRRANGAVVRGGFRDIVDTGELRQSQDIEYDLSHIDVVEANILFSAPHYRYVRYGTRNTPGRDFVNRGYYRVVPYNDFGAEVTKRANRY